MGSLGDNDNVILNQEFQGYLCGSLTVFFANTNQ